MTKYSLSAASLVTAIPAGYLAYLLVMAFLQQPGFDNLTGFFKIIAGLTLLLVTLMVLMPVGILIFGQKPEESAKKSKKKPTPEELEAGEPGETSHAGAAAAGAAAVGAAAAGASAFADDEDDFDDGEEIGVDDDEFGDDEFEDDEFGGQAMDDDEFGDEDLFDDDDDF